MNETKKKTGRKRIELDWEKFDTVLQFMPSIQTCAEILGVSHDTIERALLREKGVKFAEYRESKMSKVRVKLVQKALEQAYSGNSTMLIFCLKNLCGWSDKQEMDVTSSNINIEMVKKTDVKN